MFPFCRPEFLFELVALVRDPRRPRRRLLPARLRRACGAPVLAALRLLLQVLARHALAELAAVDARPLLVRLTVLAPAEMQLLPVDAARGHHRVHVHVPRVPVNAVHDDPPGVGLALVLGDHLLDLLVATVFVERILEPVVGALLLPLLPAVLFRIAGPRELVLFELAHVLGEVLAPLLEAHPLALPVDVLRNVLRPDALVLAARRDDPRVVEPPTAGGAGRADSHREIDTHSPRASPTSETTRSTSRIALSTRSAVSPRPPPFAQRAM